MADLFTLFATPLSGTVRSIEQFRKGVDEFLKGVENFNRTMENLNETTERINALLIDVEQPIRAAIPQVTRTVKAADEMMQVVSGPAMAVAPGLHRLAETLSTPAFAQLPNQIGAFSDVLGEVSRRLGPLTQLAESAGGLFGGFRLPGATPSDHARRSSSNPNGNPRPSGPSPPRCRRSHQGRRQTCAGQEGHCEESPAKKASAKKASAKKRPAKKSAPTSASVRLIVSDARTGSMPPGRADPCRGRRR